MSLLLGDAEPVLSYAEHGDTRVEIGVVDRHGEGTVPGPYLVALGEDGETAWSVRVNGERLMRGMKKMNASARGPRMCVYPLPLG